MKRISISVLGFAFSLMLLTTTQALAAVQPGYPGWNGSLEKPVRVRLENGMKRIVLQGLGIRWQGQRQAFVPVSIPKLNRVEIERLQAPQGLIWQIKISESGKEKIEIKTDPVLVFEGRDLRRGAQSLPSRLVLHAQNKSFDLIGILPLENYLVGVISSEMPLRWPLEALKAQTVAARSYTLAVMRARQRQYFDVESSILDQVFNHVSNELDSDRMIQKAKQAVEETRGVVLLDQKGQVTKAYYHADCGGSTSPAKIVWGAGEKTPVVVDNDCPAGVHSHWTLTLSQEELQLKLSKRLSLPTPIDKIIPIADGPDQRSSKIRLALADGTDKVLNAHEFRAMLGYSDLKSTFFQVEKKDGIFEFRGRGWGHGVGLCQWGSRRMAERGLGAFDILKHYYPLSRLSRELVSSQGFGPRRTAEQK